MGVFLVLCAVRMNYSRFRVLCRIHLIRFNVFAVILLLLLLFSWL